MESFDHILLFKTDCKTADDKATLQSILSLQPGVEDWNLDLDDCDYVLRIVSHTANEKQIIKLLNQHGYNCCELI